MVGARFATRAIGLVSTVIIARLLLPEDFGLVSLSAAMVAAVEVFGSLGFDLALISEKHADRDHYDTVWTLTIIRSLLVAIVLAASAGLASSFFNEPRMLPVLYVLAFSTFLEGLQNVGVVDFRKQLNFHQEFMFLVAAKLASFVTTVTLAILWRNYWALVAGIAAGRIVGLPLSYLMHSYRPRFSLKQWRSVFGFSIWILIMSVVTFFTSKADTFTIGRLLGTHALGIYEIGSEIANLPTGELVLPIQRALLPGYAKLAGDEKQLAQSYVEGLSVILFIALPASIGIAVVGDLIVSVFLGAHWFEAIPLLRVLSWAGALRILQANSGSILLALGEARISSHLSMIGFCLLVPCVVGGALLGGALGVAGGLIISYSISVAITMATTLRRLSLSFTMIVLAVWRTFAAAGTMALAVLLLSELWETFALGSSEMTKLLVLSLLGAISYAALHLLLWRLSGFPSGPERHVWDFVSPMLIRWRMAFARSRKWS